MKRIGNNEFFKSARRAKDSGGHQTRICGWAQGSSKQVRGTAYWLPAKDQTINRIRSCKRGRL